MNGWMKLAAALFAAASFAGCSLLKVAVATGDPLSKEEMNIRTMTRGFYYDMASEVARTADSIAAAAPDIATRVAAVRWKIRATRAGVSAAMQGIPDVALADMWLLCRRMDEGIAAAPDSLLFGAQSGMARDAAARLDRRAARLARQVLAEERYGLMERFVAQYVRDNPSEEGMEAANTTLARIELLRENGFNFIVCLTKADKLSKSQQGKQAASIRKQIGIPADRLIVTSSESGMGIARLKQANVDICLDDENVVD